MNRLWVTCLAALPFLGSLAVGQIIQTRVYTEPPGNDFFVDGTRYTSSATFLWPKGSKHTVGVPPQQNVAGTTRMSFQNWADDRNLLLPTGAQYITVTADENFTGLKAVFQVEHRVDVLFRNVTDSPLPSGTGAPPMSCPSISGTAGNAPGVFTSPIPGVVFVDGVCYANSVVLWAALNATMTINAFPARGFVFEGWIVAGAAQGASFLRNFVVRGHTVISPRFSPAKRVILQTDPPGLKVSVNRTVIDTDPAIVDDLVNPSRPWELDLAEGSSHVLGAPSPQMDRLGRTWVLDSFSTGGGEGSIYKAVNVNTQDTITARFIRGANVSILTNPPNLRVSVNGRENWPSYNFVWGWGTKQTVTAPAETTDARGRRYRFLGWAHGGPATQEITVPSEDGYRIVANYELIPRLTIRSDQPGMRLNVDGNPCALPCTLDRVAGTTLNLSVANVISTGIDSRLEFAGWNDNPDATRAYTIAGDAELRFGYRAANRLTVISDPAEGATFRIEPSSGDGFYPVNQNVQITAVAREGFRFRRWEGDLSGTSAGGFLSMNVPRLVRAQLDKVPHISSAGIRNAAGETPERAVAAGSIISIFGSGLASAYVPGPASGALPQTLGNVTVRVGGMLLPLLFVSPDQVNAYLPSDLADGEQTLAVRSGLQPEISGKFQVVRVAPGIFGQTIDDKFYLTAQRPDGSIATPDKPAKRGEQISFLGTGFGPYQRPVVDGFPAPDNPPNPLRIAPEVLVGDAAYQPDFAGAAPGMVGVAMIRFTIPADWPANTAVELRIRQAGIESNPVILPVE